MKVNKAAILTTQGALRSTLHQALTNLGLEVIDYSVAEPLENDYRPCALVIADMSLASELQFCLDKQKKKCGEQGPCLVAITTDPALDNTDTYDDVLLLPSSYADISARLSVVFYAHTARRTRLADNRKALPLGVFNSLTSGVSIADARLTDLPLIYVNPAFEMMTGYHYDEIEGQNCRFLQQEDRDQTEVAVVRNAIIGHRRVTVNLRNYRKDGILFLNQLSLFPVRDVTGTLAHYVGVQTDITERPIIQEPPCTS